MSVINDDDELDLNSLYNRRLNVIESHWPYDGPHTPDGVAAAAHAVERLTRYLANATQPHLARNSVAQAPTVGRIVSELAAATAQVLDQIEHRIMVLADDPCLYDDRRSDLTTPTETATKTAAALLAAREPLAKASMMLQTASGFASHLGHNE
jgi:hypothetical protein